jgi:hypothetical protein
MPDERPGRRAFQIYLYAVCLVTVVVVLFSSASAVYALIRIAAPGTTAQGDDFGFEFGFISEEGGGPVRGGDTADAERDRGVASLAENGIFALAAAAIFWWHWQQSVQLRAQIAAESSKPSTAPRKARTRRA